MIQTLFEIFRLKKRMFLIVIILSLINLGLAIYVVNYQISTIADFQQKWNELRRSVAVAGKQDVNAFFQQGKAGVETLQSKIPPKREFPRVLGDILDAASSSGTVIGNVSYKPQMIKDENLLAYGVTMSVGGSYASVKSFLADVVKNRELIVLNGFTLSNTDLYEEFVTMDLHLTVYLRENT